MYNTKLRERKRLVKTDDGSHTLYSAEFDETYHSDRDGALYESLHKHVIPALTIKSDRDSLKILDICFGIGYNTLATLYYIKNENLSTKIEIVSPEFDKDLIESLSDFDYPSELKQFAHIIEALSREYYYSDEQFTIEIVLGDARDSIPLLKDKFDIVYQDPFSPEHNPQLWTREYFQDIRKVSKSDTILTTYSIAASVRMGLDESGFKLFLLNNKGIRDSMIASLEMLNGYEFIDMELKKMRNPTAVSLRD